MGSFGYYFIKDLYVGTIVRMSPYATSLEDATVDYWAFEKKIDKNTGAPTFTPLKENAGYYYIEEMQPLNSYLNSKAAVIKRDGLENVIQKIKEEKTHNKILKLKDREAA